MANNFERAWLLALEERFGVQAPIAEVTLDNRPRMLVYYFSDFPAKDMFWNTPGFECYNPRRASLAPG
ncbi:MAG: hypothetical protein ABW202_11450 [Duganella sp.]